MNSNKEYSIYHDLVILGTPKRVYDAVSLPEHLNNWWTLKCTGTPKQGTVYNLYFAPEYDWMAEVVSATSNESFHLRMTRSSEDWSTTTFGFDLEEKNEGVLLKFSHLGWLHCNNEFRNSSFCWAMLLNGLKQYVENGHIVPFEERN
ncbi:SRPBCC domain-containing protein [Aureisphaera galaxeae]|uniref:SRPBCC family protein n=1 Tax=Aureisphaera galaxeae TaxID=1538023 RepID=UPI002350B73E|nr:SRPBCC domain-containing protein [Aureisphaera galaxeae]MDC8003465.1 SRPBCC domain-containing protein [Aureisphaera galaxeae]